MKDYLNRNLRPSVDDCLSSIDTLPSRRSAVLQQIADRAHARKRLPSRSMVVLALLLALISVAAAGTFSGVINWQGVPDEVTPTQQQPTVLPRTTPINASMASNLLRQLDSRMLRRIVYTNEAGEISTLFSNRTYAADSFAELPDLFADSELLLPQLSWPIDRLFDCYAHVTYDCLSSGCYEPVEERAFSYNITVTGYLPTAGADFISSVSFAGYTPDGHRVEWKARYQQASEARLFGVSDIQQYQRLNIPGMTDALAITSSNKTWIYMRRVLDEPVQYIPVTQALRPNASLASFDEIYYEISAVGMTTEELTALIPQ